MNIPYRLRLRPWPLMPSILFLILWHVTCIVSAMVCSLLHVCHLSILWALPLPIPFLVFQGLYFGFIRLNALLILCVGARWRLAEVAEGALIIHIMAIICWCWYTSIIIRLYETCRVVSILVKFRFVIFVEIWMWLMVLLIVMTKLILLVVLGCAPPRIMTVFKLLKSGRTTDCVYG